MFRIIILFMMTLSPIVGSDWLMIQGTEADSIKIDGKKVKNSIYTPTFWGFIQAKAEKNYSDTLEVAGLNKTAFSYVKPNLEEQTQMQIFRARLGLRGLLDDENKINYFILTNFGYNGISNPAGHYKHTYLTDASLTLRYVPYANLRFGLFKYPGSEEGLQARFASPFINFSLMSNFLLLEKKPKSDLNTANNNGTFVGEPSSSVGAYRDTGVELFDRLKLDEEWALSYAAMMGSGSGLQWENKNDGEYTGYGYLALERSFAKGKGYYHQDFKAYIWYQEGKRALYANGGTHLYDRIRYGLGLRYFKDGLRLEAEYAGAEGMIFSGVRDTSPIMGDENWHFSMEAGEENKAYGYYLATAYEFYPKIEGMLRYENLDNLTNSVLKHRVFKTATLGLSCHFDGPIRLDINYLVRDAKAPGNSAAQNVLDNMDNIINIQFTYKFGVRL